MSIILVEVNNNRDLNILPNNNKVNFNYMLLKLYY
jgi:hypothetical protein